MPDAALATAHQVAQALEQSGARTLYVDCNAIAPATARAIGQTIAAAGSRCVDAGIIGPPPRRQGQTRFYASGQHAPAFAELSRYGLEVRLLEGDLGQASGFKMVYAASTKGFVALATGLLVTARRLGLYDALIDELDQSQATRLGLMEEGVPGMPDKAHRWIGEMEEIAKTFAEAGLTPQLFGGVAEIYRFVEAARDGGGNPQDLRQVIDFLARRDQDQ